MRKWKDDTVYILRNALLPLVSISIIFMLIGKFVVPEVIDQLVTLIAKVAQIDVLIVDTLEFTFTNPLSLVIYILIFAIISFLLIFEYAVLITVSSMVYLGKSVSIKSVINEIKFDRTMIFQMKPLKLFLEFYVMVSILNIGFNTHLISPISISRTILNYMYNDRILMLLLIIIWGALIYTVSRYSLSIHDLFLKKNINDNITPSQIFKQNRIQIVLFFFLSALIQFCFMVLNDQLINEIFIDNMIRGFPFDIGEVVLVVLFFVTTGLKGVILIVFSISLTIIYYRHHGIDICPMEKKSSKFAIIIIIVILNLIFYSLTINSYNLGVVDENKLMVHRAGGSAVLENSYEAIEYAISNNYSAVEIDVMFLKDGEIILSHDSNLLKKTSLDLEVYNLSRDEIENINLVSDSGKQFQFISLEEVFQLTNKELYLNIELKVHGHEQEDYLYKLIDIIEKYNMEEHVCISTFEYDDLVEIEDINPRIKTIVISYYFLGDVSKLKTDGIALDLRYTNESLVRIFKKYNKCVYVWTANKPADIVTAFSTGCDYIITDEPELVLSIEEVFRRLKL